MVAVDLASADLDAAVAAIENAGGTALAVPADVTNSDQVAGYVDAAREASDASTSCSTMPASRVPTPR